MEEAGIEVKHTDDEKKLETKVKDACMQIKNMDYKEFFCGFRVDKVNE